jgi:tRNA pseudouridine55 synthase
MTSAAFSGAGDEPGGSAFLEDRSQGHAAGVYLIDKPSGITSLDAVRRLKKLIAPVRIGHTGTLDPLATGLLLICVGEATKLVPYMELEPKKYEGSLQLGLVTDSWDVTGNVVERGAIPPLSRDRLTEVFGELEGLQYLDPPSFSAIKHKGRPLYAYARKGVTVEAPPRETRIEDFRLLGREEDILAFELTCSRGTYVRAVVHAMGRRLGCGACLRTLRRLQCGRFKIEDALPLEEAASFIEQRRQEEVLLPPARVLDHLDAYEVAGPSEKKVLHGSPLREGDLRSGETLRGRLGERVRVMVQGDLAAVAEARSDPLGVFLQPIRVLHRAAQPC